MLSEQNSKKYEASIVYRKVIKSILDKFIPDLCSFVAGQSDINLEMSRTVYMQIGYTPLFHQIRGNTRGVFNELYLLGHVQSKLRMYDFQ
jgi:hypothetical protein